jgi:hypothetical protein
LTERLTIFLIDLISTSNPVNLLDWVVHQKQRTEGRKIFNGKEGRIPQMRDRVTFKGMGADPLLFAFLF